MTKTLAALVAALALASNIAFAHGEAKHEAAVAPAVKEQKPWGMAGDPGQASRTVEIRMTDAMRFSPDAIQVKRGETLRFVLRNDGRMLHEMVIGTPVALAEHAAAMRKFPGMEHDEPYMAHVAPGKTGEIVWQFNRSGDFEFACLIPGHYEAGMLGKITVGH
jgi:uncharacterized cupredoxin-like copper-binding protein